MKFSLNDMIERRVLARADDNWTDKVVNNPKSVAPELEAIEKAHYIQSMYVRIADFLMHAAELPKPPDGPIHWAPIPASDMTHDWKPTGVECCCNTVAPPPPPTETAEERHKKAMDQLLPTPRHNRVYTFPDGTVVEVCDVVGVRTLDEIERVKTEAGSMVDIRTDWRTCRRTYTK